jgi:hypothetical protein
LLLTPYEDSKGYEIKVTFEKGRAYCCLYEWHGPEYKSKFLHCFSGGHKRVVREVVRLAALITV